MKKLLNKNISTALLVLLMATIVACGGNTEKQDADQETTAMEVDTASVPEAKLNINTASGDAFRTIPNVGDKMVHEFEEYRPYVSIQQFRKEIGKYVDENRVASYEQYIFVPIHRNDSDAPTLMQIPGLEQPEAIKLIAARPYETNDAFFESLASFVNEEEMTVAKTYMKSE